MNWIYNNKEISSLKDIPENVVGFVYIIKNLSNGRIYVGKKILFTSRRSSISKREKSLTSTRKKFKTVTKESNWLDYYGSCDELKKDISKYGKQNFERKIIEFCHSKKYMTYCEMKWQIIHQVLETDSYNGNILSRFFKSDLNAKI